VEQRAAAMWRYRTIQAPFDGIVTKRFADRGAMIQAGTASQTQAMPVIRVAEIQRLRLAVSVPESFVPLVRNGTAVQIRVGALNRSFGGTVARLTRDVASNSRTMEAEIDVSNGDLRLTPGMFADVVLKLEKRERGLTIPITTVNNSGGNRSVLVVSKNGQIEERGITTGIESAATLEILSGLGEEDLVVVSNRSLLKAGQRVEAKLVAEN
jgi:RND family efflux transporter MFP subunit